MLGKISHIFGVKKDKPYTQMTGAEYLEAMKKYQIKEEQKADKAEEPKPAEQKTEEVVEEKPIGPETVAKGVNYGYDLPDTTGGQRFRLNPKTNEVEVRDPYSGNVWRKYDPVKKKVKY